MNKKIKVDLMIFDLDGTLVDTGLDIANAVNYVRKVYGLKPLKNEVVIGCVGNGLKRLVQDCLADSSKDVEKEYKLLLEYYGKHLLDTSVLYPSVKGVLEQFKGKRKAVISNKIERYCREILEGLGVAGYFELIWGRDSIPKPKPDPEGILKVIKELGASRETTIMIGDGANDIVSAKMAGIRSFAVSYGFGIKDELLEQKPDYFIDNLEDLIGIIE